MLQEYAEAQQLNWCMELMKQPLPPSFLFPAFGLKTKESFYSTSTLLEVPEIQIDRVGLSMAETHQPSCIFLNVYDC